MIKTPQIAAKATTHATISPIFRPPASGDSEGNGCRAFGFRYGIMLPVKDLPAVKNGVNYHWCLNRYFKDILVEH